MERSSAAAGPVPEVNCTDGKHNEVNGNFDYEEYDFV
jgi:hypothetical protein